jgi:glycosyltransferase involved in cell wall biosynthesis
LNSIPYRNDVQIIIVDDNSDPAIVDFTQFPGVERPNTEVYFSKEGKGAGYARNVGLQHAKGKWLVFADADDFFMPCFDEAMDAYKDDEHDVIYFKVTSIDSKTLDPHTRHEDINRILLKIQKTNSWDKIINLTPVWGRFINQDVVKQNDIVFQEIQYSNDVLFSAKLASVHAKRTIYNDAIYCVTNRNGSLIKVHTIEAHTIRFQVALDTFEYLKGLRRGKEKYFYRFVVSSWLDIFFFNIKIALSLLLKMLKIIGLWYTIVGISKNIIGILKRYISTKLLKCKV